MVSELSGPSGRTPEVRPAESVVVGLLGEVALRRDGALAPVPGVRARMLLAALAVTPGRSRSAQALIDEVWGEQPPRAPMNALHTQVSRLRAALPEGAVEIGPAGYRLRLTAEQIDLASVSILLERAREARAAHDYVRCLDAVAKARALWRGEPGADLTPGPVADELATAAAQRWADLDALELIAREGIGDLDGAIVLARAAASADPLSEPAARTLMRLLAAAGHTNEALDVFATIRAALADHLGTDPGPALAELNTAILRGDFPPRAADSGGLDRHTWEPPLESGSPSADVIPADTRSRHNYELTYERVSDRPGPAAAIPASASPATPGDDRALRSPSAVAPTGGAGHRLDSTQTHTHTPVDDRPVSAVRDDPTRRPAEDGTVSVVRGEPTQVRRPSAIGVRAAPNALLGRADDLIALEQLLCNSRVTTVLGPGGTGKTRVANELGARMARHQPVVLVELASVRADGSAAEARGEVEAAIAAVLGLGDFARDPLLIRSGIKVELRQRLRDALSERPMLLILDNCEHLIDAAAEVVADLVGSCDQLTVLTTSRAPLAITAETVYPLAPLAIDAAGSPATELFVARATAVRPTARLNPEVVARLCHRLDGLPLAIELAAARVRTMSVEEIDTRLEHRFALLRSGDRSSPERHRTLHAVIAWSWNLLDEPQQIALRRLCRFPAGFTLGAAEFVAGGPEVGDVVAAVEGLVGQSLLTVLEDDRPDPDVDLPLRYRMLETVREFGEEQLAVSRDETAAAIHDESTTGRHLTEARPLTEADLVADRMCGWAREFAVTVARRYHDDDQVTQALIVAAEMDNLTAVLRLADERRDARTMYTVFPICAMLWVMRGAHMELVAWVRRMLTMEPPHGHGIEIDLEMLGYVYSGLHLMYMESELRDAAMVRTRARRLLRRAGELSEAARFFGRFITCPIDGWAVARLLADATRSADRDTALAALILRANSWENHGQLRGSARDARIAASMITDKDVWTGAMINQHLGGLAGQNARYREAVGYYEIAAEQLRRLGAYEESLELRCFLAAALTGCGQSGRARAELEHALGLTEAGGSRLSALDDPGVRRNHRLSTVAASLADIELSEGNRERGLWLFRRALELVGWPGREFVPGPGVLMLCSAMLDAHTLYGDSAEMTQMSGQLAEVAVERLIQFWDVPQIGAVACAVGSHRLSIDPDSSIGLELLALAPAAKARQDYPVMALARHRELRRDTVGLDRIDRATAEVAGLRRLVAADRIMTLLKVVAAHPAEPGPPAR
ncbi:AfsR/SARP family transcriptional regulator [Nocardia cyriacigeorgica]|uniref:AfsR/SARP family transcriptional regulator n=1 Tax=Nocardia cyriacigeorgica TaxID=135487 RepID=UPI001895E456|nr:BTAD domain-containing putative transcriptional regulator [Nocardia cyriacigeorgica]MBF6091581.1 winged helix-turn-helix domain-containing protein [Nocardia cyriacigeorgica]